jgi:tetratricopeptide (TPR) repeat protein
VEDAGHQHAVCAGRAGRVDPARPGLFRRFQPQRHLQGFKGLDKANALAKKKKADLAAREFESILARHSMCAGIYFNQALAHARAGQFDQAITAADNALLIAANYIPARDLLAGCYQAAGRADDLKQLVALWPKDALDQELEESNALADAGDAHQSQPAKAVAS